MLSGVRVLDLTGEPGFLAGKILGDLGADVVKVEPPGGDAARRRGPFLRGAAGPERGLLWQAHNTSKRSIVLDLDATAGREELRRLAAVADAWLDTATPAERERQGLDPAGLRARNPWLVHCAITPFGVTGPRADLHAGDLVLVALGGNAWMTGDADRAPLRCSLPTSHLHAAAEAALGVALALFARERTGRGQQVDVSMHECQLGTLLTAVGQYALSGRLAKRTGPRTGRTREIWPAKDGFLSFGLRGGPSRAPGLAATVLYMTESGMAPPWLRAIDWRTYDPAALSADELARLEDAFGAFFRAKTLRELYTEALRRRILLAPCNDGRELLEHPQLRARGLFVALEGPEPGVRIEHPASFARSSAHELRVRSRAPRVGEHQADVTHEWLAPRVRETPPAPPAQTLPFAGLRLLELGVGAAGPVATRTFAELGADVLRIESRERPDFLRLLQATPGAPLDGSPMFVLLNPGKRSVALNLTRDEGIALVKRLVARADVVVENFAPGVLAKLGLDYARLREVKPDLIMASSSLFGQTGPQRAYPGFGGQGSAIAGFNALTGWPDREALGPWATITDSLSPRFLALLLAAALRERERTGAGQHLDVSQIEVGVYALCESIVRFSANGEIVSRRGNRDGGCAPHGIYPCAGDDRWIAIAVRDDAAWRALAGALGDPAWMRDRALATAAGRLAGEDALDARVAAETRAHDARALMDALQAAGVEAGVVQDFRDLLHDPQLAHRGHFETILHAGLGELRFERSGLRLSDCPGGFRTPGPDLGQHTREVLGGELGLDPAEIDRLVASGVAA